MPETVGELGEFALIERIRRRLPAAPAFVAVGIGDDAAVVEPERNKLEVLTTDSQVEGIHFDLSLVTPGDVGHKALAVNLSDIAAMGAAPRVALLSLVLPAALEVSAIDALIDDMAALAATSRTAIIGGNIARSPGPLIVNVTVTGIVHRRRVLARGGARAGDELYVTGALGGAAAGLRLLRENPAATGGAVNRYRRPDARTRVGALLGRNRAARACIDLSDGLAAGVRQLAEASGVGAIIDAASIPIMEPATLDEALGGGEDYELLFAVSSRMRGRLAGVQRHAQGVKMTRIGRLTAEPAVLVSRGDRTEELPAGFAHFA